MRRIHRRDPIDRTTYASIHQLDDDDIFTLFNYEKGDFSVRVS